MIQDLIPAKYRKVIYSVLAAAWAIEAVLDFIPEGAQGRVAAVLALLGFGLAAGNTNK
jgi:hypothetical protein